MGSLGVRRVGERRSFGGVQGGGRVFDQRGQAGGETSRRREQEEVVSDGGANDGAEQGMRREEVQTTKAGRVAWARPGGELVRMLDRYPGCVSPRGDDRESEPVTGDEDCGKGVEVSRFALWLRSRAMDLLHDHEKGGRVPPRETRDGGRHHPVFLRRCAVGREGKGEDGRSQEDCYEGFGETGVLDQFRQERRSAEGSRVHRIPVEIWEHDMEADGGEGGPVQEEGVGTLENVGETVGEEAGGDMGERRGIPVSAGSVGTRGSGRVGDATIPQVGARAKQGGRKCEDRMGHCGGLGGRL